MAAIGISAIYLLLIATYLPERSPNVHKTHHKRINFGLNETLASCQPIRAGFEAINRSWLAIEHSVMFGKDSRKNSSGTFLLSLLLLNGNIETNLPLLIKSKALMSSLSNTTLMSYAVQKAI